MTLSRVHQGLKNVTGVKVGPVKLAGAGARWGGAWKPSRAKALEIPANPVDFLSKF